MTTKIAKEILKIEKDELMSRLESDRDWELITALDIAIEALEFQDNIKEACCSLSGFELENYIRKGVFSGLKRRHGGEEE